MLLFLSISASGVYFDVPVLPFYSKIEQGKSVAFALSFYSSLGDSFVPSVDVLKTPVV